MTVTEELEPVVARTDRSRRSFAAELELRDAAGDGRTVYGRLFPIGEVANITELVDGQLVSYEEEFLPGCTLALRQKVRQRMAGVPAFLRLKLGHGDSLEREVGSALTLDEQGDGVYASFRLYEGDQLAKVRSMIRDTYKGLSVEFGDVVDPYVHGRRISRRQVNIFAVAATPMPAYASAGVLAMRSGSGEMGSDTPNLDRARALLDELRP